MRRSVGKATLMRRRVKVATHRGHWSGTPSNDDDHMPTHSPTGLHLDLRFRKGNLVFSACKYWRRFGMTVINGRVVC
jgi:hypothetical protein